MSCAIDNKYQDFLHNMFAKAVYYIHYTREKASPPPPSTSPSPDISSSVYLHGFNVTSLIYLTYVLTLILFKAACSYIECNLQLAISKCRITKIPYLQIITRLHYIFYKYPCKYVCANVSI